MKQCSRFSAVAAALALVFFAPFTAAQDPGLSRTPAGKPDLSGIWQVLNEANWMIEGGSPNQLIRRGFTKNSVPVGTELQVVGYQARDGAKRAVGRTLKFANGQSLLFENTSIPERPR